MQSFRPDPIIAVYRDGSKIYLASTSLLSMNFDGTAITDDATLYDSNVSAVEIGLSDKLYTDASGSFDVVSFNSDNTPENDFTIIGSLAGDEIRLSGDGLQMITLTGDYLNFTSIAP
jgi:hypothetical protein